MMKLSNLCLLMNLIFAAMTAVSAESFAADDPAGDEKLKALIKTVAEQEAIYANCEMLVAYEYKLVRPAKLDGDVLSSEEKLRIIRQGEFQFVSKVRKGICADGTPIDYRRVFAFDGKQTRVKSEKIDYRQPEIKRDKRDNVYDGLKEFWTSIRPHTFLLARHTVRQQSLSEYLGQTELRRNQVRIVSVQENEIVDGFNCVKVKIETRSIGRGQAQTFRYVWLASERNYFPVKSVVNGSNGVPMEESAVLKWQEVKPGVWIPKKMKIVGNDILADRMGKIAPSHRREYRVEKIDLKPGYPVEFFQDVKLPDPPNTKKSE